MLKSAIDHLVVSAHSLNAGVAYVADALGVSPQPGGEHPRMGTHNALLRLGATTYLEVIAADPRAKPPSRPRWFELDQLLPSAPPRLATWVVRTSDIHEAASTSLASLGSVEAMTRNTLNWLITMRPDGRLPLEGAAPSLIQWSTLEHPAATLVESGCVLLGLEVRHPQSLLLGAML